MVAIYKILCISPDVTFLNIVSLSHKTTFCILLNILFTSSGLNKTLMPLVNYFMPPPKHPITKGTTMTLYSSRLSRNSNTNCWYFRNFSILFSWMFDSYRLCRSSFLIRLLTSGRIASPCSLSSSDVPSPRGVYIRSSGLLLLSSSFHSTILCLVEVRHC